MPTPTPKEDLDKKNSEPFQQALETTKTALTQAEERLARLEPRIELEERFAEKRLQHPTHIEARYQNDTASNPLPQLQAKARQLREQIRTLQDQVGRLEEAIELLEEEPKQPSVNDLMEKTAQLATQSKPLKHRFHRPSQTESSGAERRSQTASGSGFFSPSRSQPAMIDHDSEYYDRLIRGARALRDDPSASERFKEGAQKRIDKYEDLKEQLLKKQEGDEPGRARSAAT